MRLSRPCYDKFHRCPGWIGGGDHWAKVRRCDGGRIQVDYDARLWKWRTWRCNRCDVVVLPYMARWLSPWQWAYEIRWKLRDWAYRRWWRRG